MFDSLKHSLAILLISIAGFLQPNTGNHPIKPNLGPTPTVVISIIAPTASLNPTLTPMLTKKPQAQVIQKTQAKPCHFDSEGFRRTALADGADSEYVESYINMVNKGIEKVGCEKAKAIMKSNSEKTYVDTKINSLENKVGDLETCKRQMDQYTDCINNEKEKLKDYKDCITGLVDRYCSKPTTGYCFKPICAN